MSENSQSNAIASAGVQGRVCTLGAKDFYSCEAPVIYPVTNTVF